LKKDLFPFTPKYIIYSVEFQKRGLPHAHILINYSEECIEPQNIDAVISAELPDDPHDEALVRRFMMHSHPTNGEIPPYCQNKNNTSKCRFQYPRPVNEFTHTDSRGHVIYRRRSTRDKMVVPYNLQLLKRFQCHINFEIAGTSQLFQYLFKYIHKGMNYL
jgi:hypothetical protein